MPKDLEDSASLAATLQPEQRSEPLESEKDVEAGDDASSTSTPAAPPPPPSSPIPDGGWRAWLQCLGAFCIFCNTWGLLNTFGVFQSYYERELLRTSSASQISWIGTIQTFFILFGAIWAGPLYDRGYLRSQLVVGSFMLVFGTFMTSLCSLYWQVLLAQGFFVGIGLSLIFIPTPGVLSSYFQKKRSLALGIAASGASIGGVIYPIIVDRLASSIGFGWAMRVLGFVILIIQIPAMVGLRTRSKPPSVRNIFALAPWREPPYALWALVYFFTYLGLYVPYFYIQIQSQELGYVTGQLNFYLLPILNGAGLFGRILIGHLGDKLGPMNVYAFSCMACTVLLFAQTAVASRDGVLAFCVVYGFFSGAVVSLTPTVVAVSLTPDLRQFGTRWTMLAVPPAIGLLLGNPIAGAAAVSGYAALQYVSASFVAVATLLAFAARVCKVGWGIRGKC